MINTNTLADGPPRLLTVKFDPAIRELTEKAVLLYLRDVNIQPKQFERQAFKVRWLYPYLCQLDKRWHNIPVTELKTTKPRTLIHGMNTHINRWRTNVAAVEKALNELPDSCEQVADPDHTAPLNDTVSDHGSQDQEEVKSDESVISTKSYMIKREPQKIGTEQSQYQKAAASTEKKEVSPTTGTTTAKSVTFCDVPWEISNVIKQEEKSDEFKEKATALV